MRSGSFSAMHPTELYVLNNDSGNPNNITLVAVFVERETAQGVLTPNAGVWTGTTTNDGSTWTWVDDTPLTGSNNPAAAIAEMPYYTIACDHRSQRSHPADLVCQHAGCHGYLQQR